MSNNMIYCGIFIDPNYEFKNNLDNAVKNQHITLRFKPDENVQAIINRRIGEDVSFVVTGYGNDGVNEGYTVELRCASEEISELFSQIPVPHITTGLADGAKAVNTAKLEFVKDEYRVVASVLHGTVGYFNGKEVVCH